MKFIGKVLLGLVITLMVVGIIAGVMIYRSDITEIKVTGNSFYTEEEVINLILGSKVESNTVVCYLRNHFGDHKEIPFVERYQVEIEDMHTVEIIIYEKKIIGYLDYMESYMYFDRDGTVVDSSKEKLNGVVKVEGIEFTRVVLGEKLETDNATAFDAVVTMTEMFEKEGLDVKTITFDKKKRLKIKMKKVTIELGTSEYLDLKLAELADIWPNIKKLSGTLYLDDYETGSNNTYVFIPSAK